MANFSNIFPAGFSAAINSADLVDPRSGFTDFCKSHGLLVDSIIDDGQIHRVPHKSSKKDAIDAWYILHTGGKIPVGICGCWKAPEFQVQWMAEMGREMSISERIEHDRWVAEVKAKQIEAKKANQEKAAERASTEVQAYAEASADHPYLQRKRVQPHGIKVDGAGSLVVPITNKDGEIVSHQRITADGAKKYLGGGEVQGCFYELRGSRQIVFVGEGFATCASVFEATGYTTLVAFDCGNLPRVAKVAKELFPGAKIVMAADNDQFTDGNPGLAKAGEAAALVHGLVVHPTFTADEVSSGKPTDFNDLHTLRGLDAVREQITMVTEPMRLRSAFPFTQIGKIELKPIDWIIEDYIESDSLAQVFGDPGGGKSFVAIDIACCVATGTPWHGHEVRQGSVFYIAGEGHNGLARRFKAWELGNSIDLSDAPIYKSHRAAQLYDATEAAIVAQSIREMIDECGSTPSLIVIDTLARNMGGDENSTTDMNAFIQHLDAYLKEPYKCCVMVVHHSGTADKDRARGSSAMKGAIDSEYKVQLDTGSKTIGFEARKMKDAEMPSSKNFAITQIDLPINDKHGEPVKGAYLTTVDISGLMNAVNAKHKFLGGTQNAALKAIVSLEYSNKLKQSRGDVALPIDLNSWRESYKSGGGDQKNFSRAVDNLIKKGLVATPDNEIFSTTDGASDMLKPPQTTSIEDSEEQS
jgi:putative DNA primase/helicase